MIKGTINTRILKRSILKHIARNDITGIGVGMDYAVLDKTSSPSVLIVADGYSAISEGVALQRALNNLATAGARAEKIMISLIANSDCTEQIIRDKMKLWFAADNCNYLLFFDISFLFIGLILYKSCLFFM